MFDFRSYDYIVDAIDTVSSKLLLIEKAKACNTPILSCMGTGNKLNPSRFEIADISKTSVCPLAKAVRVELRKRGIRKVKVLFRRNVRLKVLIMENAKEIRTARCREAFLLCRVWPV